jgi:hypothetical protein
MNEFEEMAMNALKERDMAVRAIADFLEVLDAHKIEAEMQTDEGVPTGEVEMVLPLTPPLQTSSIQQLRMVVKSLKRKTQAG